MIMIMFQVFDVMFLLCLGFSKGRGFLTEKKGVADSHDSPSQTIKDVQHPP